MILTDKPVMGTQRSENLLASYELALNALSLFLYSKFKLHGIGGGFDPNDSHSNFFKNKTFLTNNKK